MTNNNFNSYLTSTLSNLENKDSNTLTTEDLRILINQGLLTPGLISRALKFLNKNSLIEGDYYPGDLLKTVLNIDTNYWKKNKKEFEEINKILNKNKNILLKNEKIGDIVKKFLEEKLDTT